MKKPASKRRVGESGYALPVVIFAGLIILTGGMLSVARSLSGLTGSIRQSQASEAREIAEAGIARTIADLNSDYPYLLINNLNRWDNPYLPASICPGRNTTGTPAQTKSISTPNGRYTIVSYEFQGTQFYGGTGTLKIKGERLSNTQTKILSTATVETSFDVKPKNCGSSYGEPATSSGFAGLLGWTINLGGNDVLGLKSGNVMCIECESIDDFGQNTQSFVSGELFMGSIFMPEVPRFPSDQNLLATSQSITNSTTITAGSTPGTNNNGMCATDNNTPPITHCKITNIDLSGKSILKVDSDAGPVRLYVSGNINAGGQAGIRHVSGSNQEPSPGRLGLFGNPRDPDDLVPDQTISLAGVSKPEPKAANLFAYFPDATTGINGGAQNTADCSTETGECGGGDIRGAVWTKRWDGSNSNNAQLVVPEDMPDIMREEFGKDFAISIKDYVGLGTNSWQGFQGF